MKTVKKIRYLLQISVRFSIQIIHHLTFVTLIINTSTVLLTDEVNALQCLDQLMQIR